MYKVVLVDDEEIILTGLEKAVDWEKYGCTVVASASDAASARVAVEAHHPDILFTDIRMPGEDGLAMLAGLRAEFPQMQVAVLTGHRDFDYAQRALHLGVSRFLLKPSRMDELDEAIRYMTGKLEGSGEKDEESEASGFIVRRARSYIAEHCHERLSLQEVADHCCVSPWYLSKLLNGRGGMNFYEMLNSERIDCAKALMENPSMRFADIAEEVGFSDAAHFSRVFRKLEGMSASSWRNAHCGKV